MIEKASGVDFCLSSLLQQTFWYFRKSQMEIPIRIISTKHQINKSLNSTPPHYNSENFQMSLYQHYYSKFHNNFYLSTSHFLPTCVWLLSNRRLRFLTSCARKLCTRVRFWYQTCRRKDIIILDKYVWWWCVAEEWLGIVRWLSHEIFLKKLQLCAKLEFNFFISLKFRRKFSIF